MNYVEIDRISKSFDRKAVLENISFEIRKGEIMGLIGPNGAGKTTLINIMLGILEAQTGQILYNGKQLKEDELNIKRKIGYIPQELALMEDTSCWNNLLYFATLYDLKGNERKEACTKALELANLVEEKNKKVKKLSGGMKRRLNIACGTMHKPELLILDEPTVGVDPQSRNFIFEHLLKLNREEDTTILYTSHYMEEVERLCDRIFILDEGQQVAFGDKDSIRALVEVGRQVNFTLDSMVNDTVIEELKALDGVQNIEHREHIIKMEIRPTEFTLNKAIRILEENELNLLSVDYNQISLEQVFLELTGKELRG